MASDPSSDVYMLTMCLCMPLRLGILIASMLQFATSVIFLLDRRLFEHLFRHFTGGYSLASRVVIGAIEVTGVLFGLMGIFGTWYCKKSYIASLNIWQFVRLVAWAFMFYRDVPLMMHCEDWVNSVQTMTQVHGWNQVMYEVAMTGNCSSERTRFLTWSTLTLIVFLYLVNCTSRYQEFMDKSPKHLLRLPKDPTTGIFYSHSLGERSYMTGSYGAYDHAPPMAKGMQPGGPAFGAQPPYGGLPPAYGRGELPPL
mmetsp:Transcript_104805/g.205567  ORF Transcript_104805/g.205567 Transcript_104805/m.205567 type:complete len:255 (+) Transcript_104805:124-888(+)